MSKGYNYPKLINIQSIFWLEGSEYFIFFHDLQIGIRLPLPNAAPPKFHHAPQSPLWMLGRDQHF